MTKTDPNPRILCIGTHHKTGTVWMRKVLWQIKHEQGIPIMQCYRPKRLADIAPTGPQIVVNWSSTFPKAMIDHPEARFIHVIRDPRDVLVSGTRYHQVAPLGNEKFLRETRDEWGGLNYREYLCGLPDEAAKLRHEMHNKHAVTVGEMMKWTYGLPQTAEFRFEDLMQDQDCKLFRGALESFQIEGLDIDHAVQSFWDQSLFGGMAEKSERSYMENAHITKNERSNWRTKMPRNVAEEYVDHFGDALLKLGYETDHDWVKECPKEVA